MRKIRVFTAARSEYGLFRPLLRELAKRPEVDVGLLVSGAHLSISQGHTINEIERDGYRISDIAEILLDADTHLAIGTAMGLGMTRFTEALLRHRPDILVILGDRYEAFAAAAAATICNVPIAHIHGGELSYGAIDDAFRHAITKMSHLHFASASGHLSRIIQMGELPERVFDVGALGVQNAVETAFHTRTEVEQRLELPAGQSYFIATFHPATLDRMPAEQQVQGLVDAVRSSPLHVTVFTGANADAEGTRINAVLREAVQETPERLRFVTSLGSRMYLSAAKYSALVIGNSSSGVIEAPSLGVPSVDIGLRQNGRSRANSVIHAEPDTQSILAAISKAVTPGFLRNADFANPYAKADTAKAIADQLCAIRLDTLLQKRFHDLA